MSKRSADDHCTQVAEGEVRSSLRSRLGWPSLEKDGSASWEAAEGDPASPASRQGETEVEAERTFCWHGDDGIY